MDQALVSGLEAKIEPVLILEDVQASSLRVWLIQVLMNVSDEGLLEGDWKKAIGPFLRDAKYAIINRLSGQTRISDAKIIEEIEEDVLDRAREHGVLDLRESDALGLPAYNKPSRPKLLESMERMQRAVNELDPGDSATFSTGEGEGA